MNGGEGEARPPGGRGVLEGAFALLDSLERVREAGLTRLAADSGLPKATAYRLLEQLTVLGAAEKVGPHYRIGPRMRRLGHSWRPDPVLEKAVQTPMRNFVRTTGAAVWLCLLSSGQTIAVGGAPGRVPYFWPPHPGAVVGWPTAVAKVLAVCSREASGLALESSRWRKDAATIRDAGIAFDREENTPGVSCVATPVLDRSGTLVAAICSPVEAVRPLADLAQNLVRTSKAVTAALH
ncbi:IclR family transcriptional regulator [Planotetraspora phitsanulokensis]|uniref:IclR family transcriptional regulator n=1 Tax=Planotetraspora phitsanulokensis TaxID=575192 RepID=A0A8J3U0B0_9ACTN|nr:helix-turn-helix domain-containing protein [Planotetraspora phitsanulokensis]GII35116.1 IclR family transcriptional regulator [Planotetraspora phitsanulokensis]